MSGRRAIQEHDAAWATVCFGPVKGGATPRDDGMDELSTLVVWRSEAAYGPVLVRSDPLASNAGRHAYPGPPACRHAPRPIPCDVHLWVDADTTDRTAFRELADVLVSRELLAPESAHRRVHELLAGHPGCMAAAVRDTDSTCVIGVRNRADVVWVVRSEPGDADTPASPHTVGSVVHAWVMSGGSPRVLRSVIPTTRR
ncbi:hypothetical protein AB0I00_32885 [Streptomyces sp. NPDC050803]|uniref:hypothetical protein n=1 Tax=unclassified Streptomyces TaxID=2593676 RepID=UPI003417271D